MRMTQRERNTPIGKAKATPLFIEEEPVRITQATIAEKYDVHPASVTNFVRRHPETALWTSEEVARQLEINRNMKVRKLKKYTRPPTLADVAESRGINKWTQWWQRVYRGADPLDAASPDYKKRSRWDGVKTLKEMCEKAGVHRDSVARWKREHPGHGKTDEQVVQIVKRNKEIKDERKLRAMQAAAARSQEGAGALEETEPRTEGGE